MKILSMQLKGYRRLLLKNIEYISLTCEHKIHLILGTNGSGKSSLVEELSPLPALHQEYAKDGYKHIEILHKNSLFLLKSTFSPGHNVYVFEKDGVELYRGGVVSVFRDLVKTEFGITQEIHELMTGAIKFTNMSIGERRSWFTKISDADYTYAIQYYNKLASQYRDITGAINLNQSRLVREKVKLLTPEATVALTEDIKGLEAYIAALMDLKTPMRTSESNLRLDLSNREKKISNLYDSLMAHHRKYVNSHGFTSHNDIDDRIINLKSCIQSNDTTVSNLCKKIEEEQYTLDTLEKLHLSTSGDIDATISKLLNDIDSLRSQRTYLTHYNDPVAASNALTAVSINLSEIFENIAPNVNEEYSRSTFQDAVRMCDLATQNIHTYEVNITELGLQKKEMEHLKLHSETECPKCEHKWFRGYSENKYQDICTRLKFFETKLEEGTVLQTKAHARKEEIETYLNLYRVYHNITLAWPILEPLWNQFAESEEIFSNPRRVSNIVAAVQGDLQLLIRINALGIQFDENTKLKDLMIQNQVSSIDTLRKEIDQWNSQLFNLNQTQKHLKNDLAETLEFKKAVLASALQHAELKQNLEACNASQAELISVLRSTAINDSIYRLKLRLTDQERVLSSLCIQEAVINNLEIENVRLAERGEVLKVALQALSPKDGLIAKGLTGFINHFIGQVNVFIRKIWLYPLELIAISPDETDGVDLDYKFKVNVGNNSVTSDVSRTSSGMQEIIDLAFRVVAMQYLKLEYAPLIMDEFGKTLDAAHRESAFYAVTNLLTSANFSQIFMISHYEQSYGSLKNTDITVLCDSNVVLPDGMVFNSNTIIR